MSTVLFTGGLGNQLFQYTFMLYLKEVKKIDVTYNLSNISFLHAHSGFEADKIFDFSGFEKDTTNYYDFSYRIARKISKKVFGKPLFCNDINTSSDRVARVYEGYWLNIEYYNNVYLSLVSRLKPLNDYCKDSTLKGMIQNSNSVSIHVRRGDYVGNKSYLDLSKTEYYKKSIEYIRSILVDPVFFVFSDDIDWCKQYFANYPELNYVRYVGQSTIGDLSLMLMCKNAIVANSTFSWWGASLDSKKVVIRPSTYFSNGNNDKMYPKEWLTVE